ncbi:MAG: hypothetical protein OXG58_07095 [Gemmatimonadetes bacterium]|nr:hypothetical protein [Gemmatimonadota bacterium]MCY3943922.1 hypothetical protein [Gemmatimonadota bacterium]
MSLPLLAAALLAAGACGEPVDLSGRWRGIWDGPGPELERIDLTLDLAHDLQSDTLSGSWDRWWWGGRIIPARSSGTLEGSLSEGSVVSLALIESDPPGAVFYRFSGTVADDGTSIIGALIDDDRGNEWPIDLSREGS